MLAGTEGLLEQVRGLSQEKFTVLDFALNNAGADFGYFKHVRDREALEDMLGKYATADKAKEKALVKAIAEMVAD